MQTKEGDIKKDKKGREDLSRVKQRKGERNSGFMEERRREKRRR